MSYEMTEGAVLETRPVDYDPEKGWVEYGEWRASVGTVYAPGEPPVRVIVQGSQPRGDDWIVTLGNGRHFRAVVVTRCPVCGTDLTPDITLSDGVCEVCRVNR